MCSLSHGDFRGRRRPYGWQLSCWRRLLPNGPPWKSRMRYIVKPGRVPSKSPRGWRGLRWGPGFTCALALGVFLSGAAVAQDTAWQGFTAPLRMVNLNPFHLLYGVPASFGARVMPSGSSAEFRRGNVILRRHGRMDGRRPQRRPGGVEKPASCTGFFDTTRAAHDGCASVPGIDPDGSMGINR